MFLFSSRPIVLLWTPRISAISLLLFPASNNAPICYLCSRLSCLYFIATQIYHLANHWGLAPNDFYFELHLSVEFRKY
jgi:hypothetical protein